MTTKVKLVAIAKDEAAYLPEWIAHHLYFGFDKIEVHVNNTSDNTWELADCYKHDSRVSFFDSDDIFQSNITSPQHEVYLNSYTSTSECEFSHVMFLDVDEFWTPLDLDTSIKECVSSIPSDVICFEWFNKIESEPFSKAIDKKSLIAEHHNLVKSIVKTGLPISEIKLHNITSPGNFSHCLANGEKAEFKFGKQQITDKVKSIKDYVVIHRMFRSELEYVSLLGRGRPASVHNFSRFKNNRNGFCITSDSVVTLEFDSDSFKLYSISVVNSLSEVPSNILDASREFVLVRFESILSMIETASISELATVNKVLTGVTSSEVCKSYSQYLINVSRYLAENAVDLMRDGAIALENRNISKAYDLMTVACEMRPTGRLINNKLREYKARLGK
ncbi:glycosyltransferase family 2 protein [Vibrio astriarenae]